MSVINGGSKMSAIIDEKTPPSVQLAAKYKKTFAYDTFNERLPTILTKIIYQLSLDKDELAEHFDGEITKNDLKDVIAGILRLKYELEINKELTPLHENEPDKDVWNELIEQLGENRTYFTTKWLYAECYLYRRLKTVFDQTDSLQKYDYFQKLKDSVFIASMDSIQSVLEYTSDFYSKYAPNNESCANQLEDFFHKLLRINLWSNRCDLSISNGTEVKQTGNPFKLLPEYESSILVNNSQEIWKCLKTARKTDHIDIIMDNAGYELFTDLVLADFIIQYGFVKQIRFHCKSIPWFVSDVNSHDFYWTISQLANSDKELLSAFGKRLQRHIETRQIELRPINLFWTSPYEYQAMRKISPKLYDELAKSRLLIFKGDLNYRKLLADMNWPPQTPFSDVLGEFRPTNLCTLRTVKAELICGLPNGLQEKLDNIDSMWMITGNYAVMQFAPKIETGNGNANGNCRIVENV